MYTILIQIKLEAKILSTIIPQVKLWFFFSSNTNWKYYFQF